MNSLCIQNNPQQRPPLYKGQEISPQRCPLQWNPTLGEQNVGRYIGVAFIEVLFCTQTVHLGPGFLAVIQRWPLFRGGR